MISKRLGRFSRGAVSVAAATALLPAPLSADPVPTNCSANVFCFRITDIEQASPLTYRVEFEVLNWSNLPARGVYMAQTVGSTSLVGTAPRIAAIGIDPDGRGGPIGGSDIGPGIFDVPAIHSGRGRGDLAGLLNDWAPGPSTPTSARWSGGTPIPFRDLLGAGVAPDCVGVIPLIPGAVPGPGGVGVPGTDALGDSSVDGGPGVAPNPVIPEGSGNVLDGFVMTITDWHPGETISLNWQLLDLGGAPITNGYGFGVVNIHRSGDPNNPEFPCPTFYGNSGFTTGSPQFYDNVWQVPPRALFGTEFGGGIVGPFANPNDNQFDQQPNTQLGPQVKTYLTELFINPPGADQGFEAVEIQSAVPNFSAPNWYYITLDGDGAAAGVVDQAVLLSPRMTGPNCLLLVRDATPALAPPPDPATFISVFDFTPDIENGSITHVLGYGFPPAVGTDLDLNNDGTLDLTLGVFTTIDAVSYLEDDGAANFEYADDLGFPLAALGATPPFTADAAYRILDCDGKSPLFWVIGDVLGANPGPYFWDPAENINWDDAGVADPSTISLDLGRPNFVYCPPDCPEDLDGDGDIDDSDLGLLLSAFGSGSGGDIDGDGDTDDSDLGLLLSKFNTTCP